ncbi:carcinoembryonic antigen-related cell adhesion molecule 16-like [Eublepharis macularius]|uniref:Carcinoembryonic antigen-related cell adhesion molecule 16-like n=1 Tax=Eublepharis macularius TaxID=481883 RepID=A0AA97LGT7_EUBMA|nr:carcinoembryonic antigen-related cell adhesion molecule 16-like [Eublepharis macularius]
MGRRREGARMGPTSGFPARRSSWLAALLAASILSSCFLLTQAQDIHVTMEPSQPLEGQDVTLTPGGPPDFLVCTWYRGEEAGKKRIFTYIPSPNPMQQNGPASTGRETGGPGCSLHIRSLLLNDTGNYIVSKFMTDRTERGRAHVEVLE